MKRRMIIVAVLLLVMSIPLFANQLELGISATMVIPEAADSESEYSDAQQDVFETILPGFHIAYRWWEIFYATWDSMVMPPEMITDMTGVIVQDEFDPDFTYFRPGPYRPGFLNLWDLGIKLILGPVVVHTELGVNTIYVHNQSELPDDFSTNFGANWRAGVGVKFNMWGVNADFTSIFPSFNTMIQDIQGLIQQKPGIKDRIKWVPSLTVILYL